MLEIAEIKISSNKQPLKHIKTLIFLVNVTLEKPPTTLGENQFESSSLFLKNVFLQQENFSKNYSKIYYFFSASKLIRFQPNRPPGNFSVFSKKSAFSACSCCCSACLSAVLILLKSCLVCVPNCCLFLLLVQKSPLLSCSPSPNLLMKE
jgi:hypothetical protein